MLLKLRKIESFLSKYDFIITAFYTCNGICKYIKIFSVEVGDTILLYIDKEYEFVIDEKETTERNITIFNISKIEVKEGENIIEKYKDYPDENEIGKKYTQTLNIENKLDEDIEEELENNYKKKIFLNDLEREQILKVKDCYRQLKRLSLCVQDLRYRLCIVHDEYFCVVEEEKIVCYNIKSQNTNKQRLFFTVVELELFYEKTQSIVSDNDTIRKGIYKVLDSNQDLNSDNLFKLLNKFNFIEGVLQNINSKKDKYIDCIEKYDKLLENIHEREEDINNETQKMEDDHTEGRLNDTLYVHQKSKLEEKIHSIKTIKQKILKNITDVRQLCDHIYLLTDKVEFDNTIMIDALLKNLLYLESMI